MDRVNDTFLLIGRLLIAALFLSAGIPKAMQGYGGGFANYLGSLGVPYAEIVGVIAVAVEVLVPVALILGLWPRLSALLLIAFIVIATGLAHRFWEFPAAAQQAQMTSFLKNIAIIGGLLLYYVSGPGAWSLSGRSRSAAVGAAAPAQA
jgi:putative oxidoreductase